MQRPTLIVSSRRDVWCDVSQRVAVARQKTNKVDFSVTKTSSTWGFFCIYISSDRNRKDQRLRAQAGERSGVTGAISRH